MKMLAGDWWTTGAFWQYVISSVIGVLVGVLGAWATLRSSNPKLKLNWWVKSNTALFNLPPVTINGSLTVQLAGRTLSQPRIVELAIANTGRRDITSAMFHNNDPIQFSFAGAKVMALLYVTTEPSGTMPPLFNLGPTTTVGGHVLADDWLAVEPALIRRGQVVVATFLVDGDEKPVELTAAPLVDVRVAAEAPGQAGRTFLETLLVAFTRRIS